MAISNFIKERLESQEKAYKELINRMQELSDEFMKLNTQKLQLESSITELRGLLKECNEKE